MQQLKEKLEQRGGSSPSSNLTFAELPLMQASTLPAVLHQQPAFTDQHEQGTQTIPSDFGGVEFYDAALQPCDPLELEFEDVAPWSHADETQVVVAAPHLHPESARGGDVSGEDTPLRSLVDQAILQLQPIYEGDLKKGRKFAALLSFVSFSLVSLFASHCILSICLSSPSVFSSLGMLRI